MWWCKLSLVDVGGDDEEALVVLRTGTLCQHHDYNVEPHVGSLAVSTDRQLPGD